MLFWSSKLVLQVYSFTRIQKLWLIWCRKWTFNVCQLYHCSFIPEYSHPDIFLPVVLLMVILKHHFCHAPQHILVISTSLMLLNSIPPTVEYIALISSTCNMCYVPSKEISPTCSYMLFDSYKRYDHIIILWYIAMHKLFFITSTLCCLLIRYYLCTCCSDCKLISLPASSIMGIPSWKHVLKGMIYHQKRSYLSIFIAHLIPTYMAMGII